MGGWVSRLRLSWNSCQRCQCRPLRMQNIKWVNISHLHRYSDTKFSTLCTSMTLYFSEGLSTVFLVTGAYEVVYMWLDFEMETNLRNHSCRRRAPCHFNKFSLRYIFAFMQLDDWWGALVDVIFCSVTGIFFLTWNIDDRHNNGTGEAINQRICLPNSSKVLI